MKPPALLTTLIVALVLVAGCAPRVNLSTGTTIGLKATPGDGNTRPPQVTLGYKRAEGSLVPVEGTGATSETDAASTLAAFHFSTTWFDHTELDSFIATGMGAKTLVQSRSVYIDEVAGVTLGAVSEAIQARRMKLTRQLDQLTESQAQGILDRAQYKRKPGKNARESVRDYILDAQTELTLERLESAFYRQP